MTFQRKWCTYVLEFFSLRQKNGQVFPFESVFAMWLFKESGVIFLSQWYSKETNECVMWVRVCVDFDGLSSPTHHLPSKIRCPSYVRCFSVNGGRCSFRPHSRLSKQGFADYVWGKTWGWFLPFSYPSANTFFILCNMLELRRWKQGCRVLQPKATYVVDFQKYWGFLKKMFSWILWIFWTFFERKYVLRIFVKVVLLSQWVQIRVLTRLSIFGPISYCYGS